MKELQKIEGYILVSKDQVIKFTEIEAKHVYSSKREIYDVFEISMKSNPILNEYVEFAKIEGYSEIVKIRKDYDSSAGELLYIVELQELCGRRFSFAGCI